jgi:excinuclease ABC subunit C
MQIRLEGLPPRPGCYLMKNAAGEILYVGKAVNLRSRVRSYFHGGALQSRKTSELVGQVSEVEWIVVASELEALILEMTLIKRHRPKYNIRLKDDKRYPYVKVHWSDPFPKVTVTRRMIDDGSRYYGPYTSMWAVHQTLDVLRKVFPYLTCDRVITGLDRRACLYYDIKLCAGPCIGVVDQETYRGLIGDLCRFLEGHSEEITQRLDQAMAQASERLEFERAAAIRDQLQAIGRITEGQKVVSQERIDSDVIAFARDQDDACVQIFFIRSGKLIGREYFILEGSHQAEDREIVEAFIKQYYAEAAQIPERLLLPLEIEEAKIIESWLNKRRGGEKVKLLVPRRGKKKALMSMAAENATETLAMVRAQWEADRSKHVQALADLQAALRMSEPPNRIECYDISNLQGTAAAGSMVVFEQGAPQRQLFRKFTIKTVRGQDDFASMEEVLSRRFRRWQTALAKAEQPGGRLDRAFGLLPDLLIVDGGQGQLSRAVGVLKEFGLQGIPVMGLAKAFEEVFLPGQAGPIVLDRRSEGLHLLQRVRDEAHRFALSQHRTQRRRTGLASQLDAIDGIGPARRRALIRAFGDIEKIRQASLDQLIKVPGLSKELAQRLKAEL